MFKTICPKCGARERLFLTSALLVSMQGVRLTEDGFDLYAGENFSTEDEKVICKECGTSFDLGELLESD